MDIHKPKAAHSVREFLTEIGTITIGILIALSLEAALEAHRNHQLVEHARADLRHELDSNRRNLVRTLSQEMKVTRSLNVLMSYAKAREAGRPAKLPANLDLSNTFAPMSTAAWESTVATQALSHMPYPEAQALAQAYAGSRGFSDFEQEAMRHWFELSTLPDDPSTMSVAEIKSASRELSLNLSYQLSLFATGKLLLGAYSRAIDALGQD